MRDNSLREALESAAEEAVRAAVSDTVADDDVHVMFLIDKSGSMAGAIEKSKEALIRILAGFPAERLHIATFDTVGKVITPKAPTKVGITHALDRVTAGGGTTHAAAVRAFHEAGVRVPDGGTLIVIVVGDEGGESGQYFGDSFGEYGYQPAALALVLNVERAYSRGSTVRDAAAALRVPYSEVGVDQFDDPYQVTRVLRMLLDAPVPTGSAAVVARAGWLDKVLATPLLTKP